MIGWSDNNGEAGLLLTSQEERHNMSKKYKAVMHFNKPGSKAGNPWTVHYRGVCHIVSAIECHAPMISEFKPEKKSNPKAFFTSYVTSFEVNENNVAILR